MKREITPVKDNREKQQTYSVYISRFNRAYREGFYFEALLIDYALMEDRLRSFIYHIGGLRERLDDKIGKGHAKEKLSWIVSNYKSDDENGSLGISNITGKLKIVRATLRWSAETEGMPDDRYLKAMKSQYEGEIDIGGLLETLEEIVRWCRYRNELIHGLMNKNNTSVDDRIKEQVAKGMELSRFLDSQVRCLKKYNRIRKSLGYKG